jgi:hypothetical protein
VAAVDICNRALQKLGSASITSLTDGSPEATACNLAYEPCKLALLEQHEWGFSIKRDALSADSPAPTWGRENAFSFPSDCLRLAHQYPEDNDYLIDTIIEGRKILTNESAPLYIRYVYNVTDTNEMTPLFREALATLIAFELCEQITQSNTKKAQLENDLKKIISEAKRSNAIQQAAKDPPTDPWIAVRD